MRGLLEQGLIAEVKRNIDPWVSNCAEFARFLRILASKARVFRDGSPLGALVVESAWMPLRAQLVEVRNAADELIEAIGEP